MPLQVNAQPAQGGSPGRKRNTATNTYSKSDFMGGLSQASSSISGGGLPTLDPAAIANYYAQLDTLQASLTNQLAGLRSQRVGLRGEASAQKSDVRQQGQAALTEGINSALERGMLGSTSDVEGRIGTRAATQTGVADVNRQLYDALAQNRIEASGAVLTAQQGAQQIASTAIAQRMQLQAEERANALQIQIANMQAEASRISTAAEMAMANKQLQVARDEAHTARLEYQNMPSTPKEWAAVFGLGGANKPKVSQPKVVRYSSAYSPALRNGSL